MAKIKFKNELDYLSGYYYAIDKAIKQIKADFSQTPTLKELADKIERMHEVGNNPNIIPMLKKIATGRIKSLSRGYKGLKYGEREYLGKGHFYNNFKPFTLNTEELEFLRRYINR